MTITPGTSSALHQIHLQDETKIQTVIWTNISQTGRTQGVSDSICLKNNLCFEVPSFTRLSQQPNFSQRQTPNKRVFNLPRLLSLLAPPSMAMKAALQQQCGVANSLGVCFAHDLRQYFMISFIMAALNILWQRLTGSVLIQVA